MAKEDGFSIISMHDDDDEEEITIEAGVSSSAVSEQDEGEEKGDQGEKAESKKKTRPAPAQSDNTYQPTTIEDLDAEGPFPKMRIVILLGGLILLIGIVIYFVFIR